MPVSNIVLEVPRIDYKKVQLQLFTLEASFGFTKDAYRSANPRLSIFRDARIIVFSKCINVINSALFSVSGLDRATISDEWWNQMRSYYHAIRPELPFRKTVSLILYDTFVRTGFSVLCFAAIESSLRDFVRALMPELAPTDVIEVRSVYDKLLKFLKIGGDYAQLLDLYRLVRNTLHNGFYFNPWNPNKGVVIPYKGKTYPFVPYEPVDFADWEFVLMLARDVRWLLYEIVNHPKVLAQTEIVDTVGKKLEAQNQLLLFKE